MLRAYTPSAQAQTLGAHVPTPDVLNFYHGESYDLGRLKAEGIVAIIHKATEGTDWCDDSYQKRKREAKKEGFLWGCYHFARNSDWTRQVDHFLKIADPQPDELVAWDWEEHKKTKTHQSLQDLRSSVQLLHERLRRYPLVYGGSLIRELVGGAEDPVLKLCPLWYVRFTSADADLEVPRNTWPGGYTLWQYTSSEEPSPAQNPPGPITAGGKNVDRNIYLGSDAELKDRWPLS